MTFGLTFRSPSFANIFRREVIFSKAFSELGLAQPLLRAASELGYETATPIQCEAIPVVLSGRDLIGCAQTGTGKTAAFTLPLLDRLAQSVAETSAEPSAQTAPPRKPSDGHRRIRHSGPRRGKHAPRVIRALVLAPTRELAAQIGNSVERYGRHTPLRHTVVYGGVSQHHQVNALRGGVDLLIATPGRLLDLMDQGYIDLNDVEILVFDEADQMLDMGFLPALNRIVAKVPSQRQTLMFSATMPNEIRSLAQKWLSHPVAIQVAPPAATADRIAQSVHMVDARRKPELLTKFLQKTDRGRTLVFSRTKHGADKIVRRLQRDGIHAAAIHGNKSQGARNRALALFKSSKMSILVATDIAARGLDIDDVSHVVNFDLPDKAETYVHRIGRTARAGASGVAVSFCAAGELGLLRQIERLTRIRLDQELPFEGMEPSEPASDDSQPSSRGSRKRRPVSSANREQNKRPGRQHSGAGRQRGPATKQAAQPRRKKRQARANPKLAAGKPA